MIEQTNGVRQGSPDSPIAFGRTVAKELDTSILEAAPAKATTGEPPFRRRMLLHGRLLHMVNNAAPPASNVGQTRGKLATQWPRHPHRKDRDRRQPKWGNRIRRLREQSPKQRSSARDPCPWKPPVLCRVTWCPNCRDAGPPAGASFRKSVLRRRKSVLEYAFSERPKKSVTPAPLDSVLSKKCT